MCQNSWFFFSIVYGSQCHFYVHRMKLSWFNQSKTNPRSTYGSILRWTQHFKKNMSKTSFDVNITYSSYPGVEDSKYLNSLTHFFSMSLWILKKKIFFRYFMHIQFKEKQKKNLTSSHKATKQLQFYSLFQTSRVTV